MKQFVDRSDAGKQLGEALEAYTNKKEVIVLALPRGGVPVAYEIARLLSAPLDIVVVRKLGVPWNKELSMGAIAMNEEKVFNEDLIRNLGISKEAIENAIRVEQEEINRRNAVYREGRPFPSLRDKIVILVDDGIATGATMRAAIKALRNLQPAKIVVAVPVSEKSVYEEIKRIADEMVCLLKPQDFYAVGEWYENFDQTSDFEVRDLMEKIEQKTKHSKNNKF